MRLYIRQKGNNYQFYKGDEKEPFAKGFWKRSWKTRLHSKILGLDNCELSTIRLKYAPWFWEKGTKTEYEITLCESNEIIIVKCLNSLRGHYSFEFNQNKYEFYFHQGHKKSLYRSDLQVAKYDKQVVSWWDNDSGLIVSNNDENEILLLSLFLMFDMGEFNEVDLTVDLGQGLDGVKEYDPRWVPYR